VFENIEEFHRLIDDESLDVDETCVLVRTLSNGMNLMNINSNWQLVFTGLILLGASLLDSLSTRKTT